MIQTLNTLSTKFWIIYTKKKFTRKKKDFNTTILYAKLNMCKENEPCRCELIAPGFNTCLACWHEHWLLTSNQCMRFIINQSLTPFGVLLFLIMKHVVCPWKGKHFDDCFLYCSVFEQVYVEMRASYVTFAWSGRLIKNVA